MNDKFKTLFYVKSSLIFLYLALTIPIPFLSSDELKLISIITFFLGLFVIMNITNDCVETSEEKISYKTSLLSRVFGKKNWEIDWQEINSIKSLPTSQGSKVHYFITKRNENFLVPQRIEKLREFLLILSKKTGIEIDEISFISPLWTYKLLTFLSIVMIIGEIIAFTI